MGEVHPDLVGVGDGQQFDLTDVRIENPFDDRGVATLLVNGEQVFIWSLENHRKCEVTGMAEAWSLSMRCVDRDNAIETASRDLNSTRKKF